VAAPQEYVNTYSTCRPLTLAPSASPLGSGEGARAAAAAQRTPEMEKTTTSAVYGLGGATLQPLTDEVRSTLGFRVNPRFKGLG